jgi:hypothetical protein
MVLHHFLRIKKIGLGGYNPISELKVLNLLRELELLAVNSVSQVEAWQRTEYTVS